MHHPFLALLFLSLYFAGAVCCGIFVFGPIICAVPDNKIKLLTSIWAVIIFLGCVAQYYGLWFLDDHPPSIERQVLSPGFFVTLFASGLVRRAHTKRLRARAGNNPSQ